MANLPIDLENLPKLYGFSHGLHLMETIDRAGSQLRDPGVQNAIDNCIQTCDNLLTQLDTKLQETGEDLSDSSNEEEDDGKETEPDIFDGMFSPQSFNGVMHEGTAINSLDLQMIRQRCGIAVKEVRLMAHCLDDAKIGSVKQWPLSELVMHRMVAYQYVGKKLVNSLSAFLKPNSSNRRRRILTAFLNFSYRPNPAEVELLSSLTRFHPFQIYQYAERGWKQNNWITHWRHRADKEAIKYFLRTGLITPWRRGRFSLVKKAVEHPKPRSREYQLILQSHSVQNMVMVEAEEDEEGDD